MGDHQGRVSLVEATVAQRPVLDQLLQLYLHDFSELAPRGNRFGEVGEDGRFAYPPGLDAYWREPAHVPLLVRVEDRIAGFVLVNTWSALDRPLDHAVAEFFVVRKHRRTGVGTAAAHATFRRFRGRWEVPVADYNAPALRFWRSVVASAGVRDAADHPGDGRRWNGTVLCFSSA